MDNQNSSPRQKILKLQEMTQAFARKAIDEYLKLVSEKMMESAEVARNNDQQWLFMKTSRDINKDRKQIVSLFENHFQNVFNKFQENQLFIKKEEQEEDLSVDLTLVANDALEENIAVTSFARRAEIRFAEDIFGLNQRLALLKGGRKLAEGGNPLLPYYFGEALQQAIELLQLDIKLKVLFFRLFEKFLLEKLGPFYKDVNKELVGWGILPNLRYGAATGAVKKAPSPAGSAAATTAQQQADAAAAASKQESVAAAINSSANTPVRNIPAPGAPIMPNPALPADEYQQQLFSAIRSLQHQTQIANQAVAAAAGDTQYYASSYSQTELASAVTALQPHHVDLDQLDNAVVQPVTLSQQQAVVRQFKQQVGDAKKIGSDNANMIDLVGMLFEYMLSDEHLPDSVKAVLSYMHTPYLKIAFLEPDLFSKPEHPARRLMDTLAEAGSRWVNNDGGGQFKVFSKIKSVVRRVVMDVKDDASLVNDLLQDMLEFNQRVQRSVDLVEQRAKEKVEGEERLKEVKRYVHRTVRDKMRDKDLPSAVVVLLLHPWCDFLSFTFLRHGEKSTYWDDAVQTIDEVLWSIEPKERADDKNKLMLMQEPLQERIQQALDLIAYDQAKTRKLLQSLNELQVQALKCQALPVLSEQKRQEIEDQVQQESGIAETEVDPATITENEHKVIEKLKMLEFGTWFDFEQFDDHKKVRLKLSWYNARVSHYMFVDRSGKQVATKTGLELARMILAGNGKIISGVAKPFFERALESIFARLKATVAS